jgi:two-component system response regulator
MKDGVILLVEDNADEVELALDALKQCKISNRVVVQRDGAAALDYLFGPDVPGTTPKVPPAVVLLDLKLPKVDGLGVLAKIRSSPKTKLLPVVILTGSHEERDIQASYDLGANSYIRKPVNYDLFVTALQQVGLYWLLLNQPPSREQW